MLFKKNLQVEETLRSEKEKLKDFEYWTSFLKTSAMQYKHSFDTQIAIHEAMPESIACAEGKTWKNFGCSLVDTSHAVLTQHNGKIRRLFDISQVSGEFTKSYWIWRIHDDELGVDYTEAVNESLNNKYSFENETLAETIYELSVKTTEKYINPSSDIFNIVSESAAFMVISRCCPDEAELTYDRIDTTLKSIQIDEIGHAVTSIGKILLSEIEKIVKDERTAEIDRRGLDEYNREHDDKRNEMRIQSDQEKVLSDNQNNSRENLHSQRKDVSLHSDSKRGIEPELNNSSAEVELPERSGENENSRNTILDNSPLANNDNIIGNTIYKYIPKKSYRKYDTDIAMKIAEKLESENIKYSGKITDNTVTFTVSKSDISKLEEIAESIKNSDKIIAENKKTIENLENTLKQLQSENSLELEIGFSESGEIERFKSEYMNGKPMSFALGNALLEYLDKKQHAEREIEELNVGWYHKTDFNIRAVINGEEYGYNGRYDIGDGKDGGNGSLTEHIRQYNEYAVTDNPYNLNDEELEEKLNILNTFVPFLQENAVLSEKERQIIESYISENSVRKDKSIENNAENSKDTIYRIYQIKSGEEYHYARFSSFESNIEHNIQLNKDDYDLVYEGNLSDINGSSIEDKLSKTYEIFNLNHPEDFRGHSLSVSDVITLDDTNAYYVDSFGFKDFPAFFLEKTITIENVNSPLANNYISDKFYENRDTQSVTWMYYNPDGNDGNGQFVETVIYKEDIEAALKNANNSLNGIQAFMDTLYNCTQTITDRGTESFPAAEKYYNEAECDFSVEGNYNAALSDIRNYLTDYYNSFDNVPALTQDDIDILRTLEPRKSILNFTSEEIKLTEKWQQRFEADIDKKSPYYRAVNGDWREQEAASVPVLNIEDRYADFKKVRDDIKSRVIERGSFVNKDTNWHIQISRNGLEDTVKYGFTHNDKVIYSIVYDSSKLIENSVLLDSVLSEKNNNNKANNTAFMHKFYSLCSFKNEPYLAKITVEEFADGQAATLKRMYNIQDIKIEPLRHIEFTDKQLARSILNGSDISISDLFKIVKTCDNDFYMNKREETLPYIRPENYDISNYTVDSSGKLYDIPLILSDEQRKRFEAYGLIPSDEQRVINFSTDNKNWNKFQLRDKYGNRWKSVDMEDILSETEIADLKSVITEIVGNNSIEQLSFFDTEKPIEITNLPSENTKEEFANGELQKTMQSDSRNYHIDIENFELGGEKAKFKANISAIKTLKNIEAEKRVATPEEQEIISKYTGWGGLQNAFDSRKDNWNNEYAELKSLLTDDEYSSAKASVLDSFYTPPFVIDSIYKALGNMGFEGGKILDPATGVGNFLGKMPESISAKSEITAVEKDSISGRIAKALYPNANVNISGFEDMIYPDNTFDVAVGNIPFGDFKLSDRNYDKHNFMIHDYFFAKAIDKIHPGGIIAFITSKGTLDKANQKVRKYISERADLIGAIRLPNNTFKSYAGTEVTSDIIFLQKREELNDVAPEWVYTDIDKNGFSVNSYFTSHPEMILGETVEGNKLYGSKDTMVVPFENANLRELLQKAVENIKGEYKNIAVKREKSEKVKNTLPANPEIQNYSFAEINGKIYYRENNIMTLQNLSGKKLARMKAMCDISKQLHKLIDMQLEGYPEETLQTERDELNLIYDKFTSEHGLLNEKVNADLFYRDVSAPLLLSLEKIKDGKLEEKSAIFTRTTLKPPQVITHAENSQDALIISISEKACVDMKFMQELTGKLEAELYADLKGDIFKEPLADNEEARYITADEYLSGNIREKLKAARLAAENSEEFDVNVKALEQAMPEPLEAGEISVQLGSAWVDSKYIEQFIREKLDIKDRYIDVKVHHNKYTASWNIENKSLLTHSSKIKSTEEYGTSRKSAAEIIENSLNMRDTSVYDVVYNADTDKEERVLNHDETLLARQKQTAIENEFKEWIFSDSDRRNALVEKYNILYNSVRQRQYNGENLKFDGMTTEIEMKPHQKDAIAHALYGGNTLFAHKVGAGKTFEMIAAAMEGKRLGLHNKSLIAVPNHMTRQFANDFFKLYPNANILVAEEKDFSKDNRRKLTAKIATGDFDAVIIGHSQLIKIPISREREEEYINRQIKEVVAQIETMKAEKGDSFTIKDMERTRKNLETKLDKLLSKPVRDNVVTFEQLGIDKLIIDEADMFKNLYINTKMRNLSGVATNESVQKTQDLYMKCQYLNEITDGKGIIFATGTPISNSISEAYVMQKYLNPKALDEAGLSHFDAWAANFAQKVTRTEFSPDGKGFRTKVRLAKFNNLPELMTMFKNFTDIKMAEDLNLPEPECERHTISVNATAIQKDLMQALGERAEKIHQKQVAPDVDNMLKITTDGTKIGLDQRLVNPILPDDPNSKVNICVDNVFKIYNDTKPERLTQVIFCDYSTPKADGSFSIYDDIKKKLIEKGIPEKEVAFIHDCKNNRQKEELFAKVRSGDVRIILGSTQKMGAGTNIQTKLYALHHLDPTWKPRDMEQRLGRMKRQGNENKKVHEYIYVTKDTFDANRYQTLEIKQGYISQIMTNHNPLRSCDDISPEEMSFAEVKAACVGNPLIKEKMELDIDIAQLQSLKSSYLKSHYRLEDSINSMPKKIESNLKLYENAVKDEAIAAAHPVRKDEEGNSIFNGITINGEFYSDKKQAGEALIAYSGKALIQNNYNNTPVGEYRGFKLVLRFDALSRETKLDVCGNNRYTINLSQSEIGNMTRIENAVNGIGSKAAEFKATAENIEKELAEAKIEFEKPFPQEQELKEKLARQSFLERELSKENEDVLIDKQKEHEQERSAQTHKNKNAIEM